MIIITCYICTSQLCKRLLDCHATVDDILSTGSELALVHSKQTLEKHMAALIERVVQLPSTKAEIHIKFNFEPKVLDALANTGNILDMSSLRGTPLHGLRAPLNGQQVCIVDRRYYSYKYMAHLDIDCVPTNEYHMSV